MSAFNYTSIQRNRILDVLHNRLLDTQPARKEFDVMHIAARVIELRKGAVGIKTMKIDRPSVCRIIHRVACYVLEVGAVAPAPADKADGIHRKETDKAENSMGGAI